MQNFSMDDLRGLVIKSLSEADADTHPNVVGTYQQGDEDQQAELVDEVLELVIGQELADIDAAISHMESQFEGDDAEWEVYEEE